jgi:hypothetical protein
LRKKTLRKRHHMRKRHHKSRKNMRGGWGGTSPAPTIDNQQDLYA